MNDPFDHTADQKLTSDEVFQFFSKLADADLVPVAALAAALDRDPTSVMRAVERGELPAPMGFLNRNVFVGLTLKTHLVSRGNAEAEAARPRQRNHLRLVGTQPGGKNDGRRQQ